MKKKIIQNSLSVGYVESELNKLTEVLNKMGFKTDLPTTCIVVNGQRKCGLIERNNLEGEQRLYVQDKIFSAIYYTKIPSKIYKIQKSVDSITFNRRGVQWHSKTIVVHPHIKKIVLSHTFKKLKKT